MSHSRRSDEERRALAEWAARVEENRAQVDRVREVPDGRDFYAPVSAIFRADPDRADDPVLAVLLDLARPGEVWLDIGAGAGRYALPLARVVGEVVALDVSEGMLAELEAARALAGIENVRIIRGRWPLEGEAGIDASGDVALIAHVGYDVAEIGPFLDAMEQSARRRCVAVLMEQPPAAPAYGFWPPVHGQARVVLPALPEFVSLLEARDRRPRVRRLVAERRSWASRDELLALLRRQLWVAPESAADRRLQAALDPLIVQAPEGRLTLRDMGPARIGVVDWAPPPDASGRARGA